MVVYALCRGLLMPVGQSDEGSEPMRKKTLNLLAIFFIILILAACGRQSIYYHGITMSWQKAYTVLLQEYALQFTETDEWGNALSGFMIYDIDKDGIPEIIIFNADSGWVWHPLSAYTFRDGSLVNLDMSAEFSAAVLSLHGFGSVDNEQGIEVISLSHNRIHFQRFMVYEDKIVITRYEKMYAVDGNWFDLRFYAGENPNNYSVVTKEQLSSFFASVFLFMETCMRVQVVT